MVNVVIVASHQNVTVKVFYYYQPRTCSQNSFLISSALELSVV